MKDSWDILSEAIREAHEMGLHLDLQNGRGRITSDHDLEMGKRKYWNLWLWEKCVSHRLFQFSRLLIQKNVVSPVQKTGLEASEPDTDWRSHCIADSETQVHVHNPWPVALDP